MQPIVTSFFDEATFTFSYVLQDAASKSCAIIDSVLNFDYASGSTSYRSADEILAFVRENDLQVEWILESHVHADHLSGAPYLKEQTGARIGIGAGVKVVQQTFSKAFNSTDEMRCEGEQFGRLFADGDTIQIGTMAGYALHTPGHTPACMTYIFGDAAFVGDTLFMPDFGTARCDFPGGDAAILYRSIKKIFTLDENTRLFMCHDYKAPGRDEYACETTVGAEREQNIHVGNGVSEVDFVKMRSDRDSTLSMPKLILPAVQVNIRAGNMPPAEDNGQSYLKIPVNLF
ncbi:MAG: glyoxylase-like metal-dependent hydrolase (beta-lactamase superfamily II) [Oceanospirillaceae bacterium]|jgi:glyoxylase-like metal-dependent hydrolase (beta-lactamase superfamily II)